MRALILLVLAAGCICGCSRADSSAQVGAQLFISSFQEGEPSVSVERHAFRSTGELFTFEPEMTIQWRTNYNLCSQALVKAAEKEGLDSSSLAQILETLRSAPENKGLAILPVAAHAAKLDGEDVWRITLRWEIDRKEAAMLS